MVVQVILYPDAVLAALTYLRPALVARTETYTDNATVSSRIPATGKTLPFVWARRVGGFLTGSGIDKARIDLHVYHTDEKAAHDLTQMVRGLLVAWPAIDSSKAKLVREFSGPGPVPDELWPEAFRFYFTVEITLRGFAAAAVV